MEVYILNVSQKKQWYNAFIPVTAGLQYTTGVPTGTKYYLILITNSNF